MGEMSQSYCSPRKERTGETRLLRGCGGRIGITMRSITKAEAIKETKASTRAGMRGIMSSVNRLERELRSCVKGVRLFVKRLGRRRQPRAAAETKERALVVEGRSEESSVLFVLLFGCGSKSKRRCSGDARDGQVTASLRRVTCQNG